MSLFDAEVCQSCAGSGWLPRRGDGPQQRCPCQGPADIFARRPSTTSTRPEPPSADQVEAFVQWLREHARGEQHAISRSEMERSHPSLRAALGVSATGSLDRLVRALAAEANARLYAVGTSNEGYFYAECQSDLDGGIARLQAQIDQETARLGRLKMIRAALPVHRP